MPGSSFNTGSSSKFASDPADQLLVRAQIHNENGNPLALEIASHLFYEREEISYEIRKGAALILKIDLQDPAEKKGKKKSKDQELPKPSLPNPLLVTEADELSPGKSKKIKYDNRPKARAEPGKNADLFPAFERVPKLERFIRNHPAWLPGALNAVGKSTPQTREDTLNALVSQCADAIKRGVLEFIQASQILDVLQTKGFFKNFSECAKYRSKLPQ